MQGQTLTERVEYPMAKVSKEECESIDNAAVMLDVSRATLYNYLNVLGVQRFRFPFDRRTYILRDDIGRIKQFIENSRR